MYETEHLTNDMSKGLGNVQRKILDLFATDPGQMWDSITIAGRVFDMNPVGDSECVSVRRALRKLAASGDIECMGHGWHDGRKRWCLPKCAIAYRERMNRVFRQMPE